MSELQVQQLAATSKAMSRLRLGARALRRDRMMPLVRVAKPLLAFLPNAERVLRVPHDRADSGTIADRAIAMAKLLKPHTRLLTSAGFEKTFLADLQAEAKALAAASERNQKAREARARVTRDLAAEIKEGMKILTVIEGILMHRYGNEDTVMKVWRSERRIGKQVGRPKQRKKGVKTATVNDGSSLPDKELQH